ncbi:MAG: TerB family tellurite resistance protein [Beijerinckiaceae bacterium]|nr:TerB family tellurite resistance protein [Beijerinckiaceae bacterium]
MFEGLRTFVAEFAGKSGPARAFSDDDVRLAAAALLVHGADSDGHYGVKESERAQALVSEHFGLEPAQAAHLIREAMERDHEEVSVDIFVNTLKRNLDANARLKIITMMWDVVFADGKTNDAEESMVWRLAGLLDVPAQDRETLRRSRMPNGLQSKEGHL